MAILFFSGWLPLWLLLQYKIGQKETNTGHEVWEKWINSQFTVRNTTWSTFYQNVGPNDQMTDYRLFCSDSFSPWQAEPINPFLFGPKWTNTAVRPTTSAPSLDGPYDSVAWMNLNWVNNLLFGIAKPIL